MIEYIKIEGYKSIKKMEMELQPINILIGGNGSGKSNFISFFKLLRSIFNRRLVDYVKEEKSDNILYFGRKRTEELYGKIIFSGGKGKDNNAYYFILSQNNVGGLFIQKEGSGYHVLIEDDKQNYFVNYSLDESKVATSLYRRDVYLKDYITALKVFHFHDTSNTSHLRRACDVNDNLFLRQDGRNLPAYLYYLQERHAKAFNLIVKTIQSVAPYIDRFILQPSRLNEKEIELRWVDTGDLESNFSAYELSDGTLRFVALTTLLLQPQPPEVVVIDEPELGLHPFAIGKLAGMMQVASAKAQIIAATQSPGLISQFTPEEVIVIDKSKEENQSVFKRLDSEKLNNWLQDYSLGDLWERNIINAAQPFTR